MRFVPIKTQEQLDEQAMYRARDRLVQRRTALIYEIRRFLLGRALASRLMVRRHSFARQCQVVALFGIRHSDLLRFDLDSRRAISSLSTFSM